MKEAMKKLIKELERLNVIITGFDGTSHYLQITLGENCPYWTTIKELVQECVPKNSKEVYEKLLDTSKHDSLWFNADEGILQPHVKSPSEGVITSSKSLQMNRTESGFSSIPVPGQ